MIKNYMIILHTKISCFKYIFYVGLYPQVELDMPETLTKIEVDSEKKPTFVCGGFKMQIHILVM